MHPPRSPSATRWGLGVLVTSLAAGFLAMHGFLAVLSPPGAHAAPSASHHGTTAAQDVPRAEASAGSAGTLAAGRAPASSGPAGAGHVPLEHHQVLTGCFVALVGVTALGLLAPLLLPRLRSALDRSGRRGTGVGLPLQPATWPLPPRRPRITLCVTRV